MENQLEITWQRAASVWWLIVWRALAMALIGGFIVGGGIGLLGSFMGVSEETQVQVSTVIGSLMGIFFGILATRMALQKKYKSFRIALLPVD